MDNYWSVLLDNYVDTNMYLVTSTHVSVTKYTPEGFGFCLATINIATLLDSDHTILLK